MDFPHCPVCKSEEGDGKIPGDGRDVYYVTCPLCGKYVISRTGARIGLEKFGPKHLLSGAIRNRYERGQRLELNSNTLNSLLDSVSIPETPTESIDLLLEHLEREMEHPADLIEFDQSQDYSLLFAQSPDEFQYYIDKARELNYIETGPTRDQPGYRPTLQGWERLEEIKKTKAKSDQVFVAMWFNDETNEAWENGTKPALKDDLDLSPLRIDMKEHNEKICDHIIAEIRKSGLLVADVTGHRQGVYFEAGFAMGLDIPVIWMCRADEIEDAHFDTRQYNHIVWENPAHLREQLVRRIEATLPHLSSAQSSSPPSSRQHYPHA